jgi:hypothetical protein
MDQASFKKVPIVSEKRRLFQPVQERNYFRILNARRREFLHQKTTADARLTQLNPLVLPDVFIQQNHAAANSSGWRKRPPLSNNETRASCTLSAIAVKGTLPPQALTMSSGVMPCASSSRICHTIIRVPLNVGLPWQTLGSATMYWPKSTRCWAALEKFALPFLIL